jgi:hypothetical protein
MFSAEVRSWLFILAKRCFGLEKIRAAGPRELLSKMSIDEFRALSAETHHSTVYNAAFFVRQPEFYERFTDTIAVDAEERRQRETALSKAPYQPVPKGLKPPPSLAAANASARKNGVLSMLGMK